MADWDNLRMGLVPLLPSNHSNSTSHHHGNDAFENLYPAVVQCFVVICAGYLAGRTGLLSTLQAQGIGTYVTKFALPALIFQSMCTLKFASVNWFLLCSFLVGKSVVFLIVAVFTLILSRSKRLGKAGLYAMFATQSNDFALGYPIGRHPIVFLSM